MEGKHDAILIKPRGTTGMIRDDTIGILQRCIIHLVRVHRVEEATEFMGVGCTAPRDN
jgi:hypothetical protein